MAEPFGAALKRYIAGGYQAPEAMRAVWHDVRIGRVARPARRRRVVYSPGTRVAASAREVRAMARAVTPRNPFAQLPARAAGRLVRRDPAVRRLPRRGYCVRLSDGRELCHDSQGYYLVGQARRNPLTRVEAAQLRQESQAKYRAARTAKYPANLYLQGAGDAYLIAAGRYGPRVRGNPQIAFDPFDYGGSAAAAKRARDAYYRDVRAKGVPATRFVLRGQLQKYGRLGVEGGGARDVYYVQWPSLARGEPWPNPRNPELIQIRAPGRAIALGRFATFRRAAAYARRQQRLYPEDEFEIRGKRGTPRYIAPRTNSVAAVDAFNPRPVSPASKLETLRRIVAHHQAMRIGAEGSVDAFTASAILGVYDRLGPQNQAKYLAMPVHRMADVAWKLVGPRANPRVELVTRGAGMLTFDGRRTILPPEAGRRNPAAPGRLLPAAHPIYQTRERVPKWSVPVSPAHVPRLLRRRLPHFTKAEHEAHARQHATAARVAAQRYLALASAALQEFGTHGPLVAGVLRGHFPAPVKDELRRLAHAQSEERDVARAHWQAAGRRRPMPQNPPARLTRFYDAITEIRGVKGRRFGFRPNTRFTHPFRSRPRAFGVDRAGSARLRRGDVLLRGRHPIYTQLGA